MTNPTTNYRAGCYYNDCYTGYGEGYIMTIIPTIMKIIQLLYRLCYTGYDDNYYNDCYTNYGDGYHYDYVDYDDDDWKNYAPHPPVD